MPRKQRKRRRRGKSTTDVDRALYPNHVWSYDFVADQTIDGRRLRFLTVNDEFTREAIWIECGRLLNSHDVVRVLGQLVESRGHPAIIKSDNGPEFVADRIQEWIEDRPVDTRFIEPGSPWQNGHNESFNGVLRDSCLNLSSRFPRPSSLTEHETRYELAFPLRSSTSHTRGLTAASPQVGNALNREGPHQNQHQTLGIKKPAPLRGTSFSCDGARDQIRTGDPHVGNVLQSLNSLMFTRFTVRRGA